MRRLTRLVLLGLVGVAALTMAGTAAALPANPWTGTWQTNDGSVLTVTQTGTQISGTQLCPGTTSLPGININGTGSADNRTASFAYGSSVCTGVGGNFTGTMADDGKRVDGSGVTQFGTGFTFFWLYQGAGPSRGRLPRRRPPARAVRGRGCGAPVARASSRSPRAGTSSPARSWTRPRRSVERSRATPPTRPSGSRREPGPSG